MQNYVISVIMCILLLSCVGAALDLDYTISQSQKIHFNSNATPTPVVPGGGSGGGLTPDIEVPEEEFEELIPLADVLKSYLLIFVILTSAIILGIYANKKIKWNKIKSYMNKQYLLLFGTKKRKKASHSPQ